MKQILKEFWFPLLISITWSFYSVTGQEGASTIKFISTLGATFFFTSWFTGQYFRVRKQNKVDSDFQFVHKSLGSVIQELKDATKDMIGYQTGGESYCYLMYSSGIETVIHQGKHPMFEVAARIVDIEELHSLSASGNLSLEALNQNQRSYGELIPGHCKMGTKWNLGNGTQRRFNIFWTARNGGFTQLLRLKKMNNIWYHATKIERGEIIFEDIQEGYPRNAQGQVEW